MTRYGYFIAFLYVVLLPSPTIYYLFKHRNEPSPTEEDIALKASGDRSMTGSFTNPLSPDEENDPEGAVDSSEAESAVVIPEDAVKSSVALRPPGAGPISIEPVSTTDRIHLASIHRIAKETDRENKLLVQQVEELRLTLSNAGGEMIATGSFNVDRPTKKNKNKNKQGKKSDVGDEDDNDDDAGQGMEAPAPKLSPEEQEISEMKIVIEDQLLSEETREAGAVSSVLIAVAAVL